MDAKFKVGVAMTDTNDKGCLRPDLADRGRRHLVFGAGAVPMAAVVAGCGGGGDSPVLIAAEPAAERAKPLSAAAAVPLMAGAATGSGSLAVAAGQSGSALPANSLLPPDPQRNYVLSPTRPPAMTGWANVGLGEQVLVRLTIGSHNTAIGDQTMWQQADGRNNVAVGALAMFDAVSTFDCTAIGVEALRSIRSGVGGTAVGRFAGSQLTSASNNTAIGDSAMRFAVTGESNTAVGYRSAERNVDGHSNSMFGAQAGALLPGGNYNTALGAHAMSEAVGAVFDNVAVGAFALLAAAGVSNVGVGIRAGAGAPLGSRNVFVGALAGDSAGQKPDVVNAVAIGFRAVAEVANSVVLGNADTDTFVFGDVKFTKADLYVLLELARRKGIAPPPPPPK